MIPDPLEQVSSPGGVLLIIVLLITSYKLLMMGKRLNNAPEANLHNFEVAADNAFYALWGILTTIAVLGLGTVVTNPPTPSARDWGYVIGIATIALGVASLVAFSYLWPDRRYEYVRRVAILCLFASDAFLLFGCELYISRGCKGATWLATHPVHWFTAPYLWLTLFALIIWGFTFVGRNVAQRYSGAWFSALMTRMPKVRTRRQRRSRK